jgi:hypothetical protein
MAPYVVLQPADQSLARYGIAPPAVGTGHGYVVSRRPGIGGFVLPAVTSSPAPAFSPADVANLVIWLDTTRGVTLNSGKVSAWADQSGQGNSFLQSNTTYQPPFSANAFGAGVAGLTTVGITTNAPTLVCANETTSILTAAGATKFIVMQSSATQAAGSEFSLGWGSGNQGDYLPYTDGNFYDEFYTNTRKTVGQVNASSAPIVYCVTSSVTDFTAYVNASQFFTTSTNTVGGAATAPSIIGNPNGGDGWNGLLGDVLVYDRELSSTEIGEVTTYLRAKYGF